MAKHPAKQKGGGKRVNMGGMPKVPKNPKAQPTR